MHNVSYKVFLLPLFLFRTAVTMYTPTCSIIIILFTYSTLSQTICFHGTCEFSCHCKNQDSCTDDVDCECEEEWSGGGCQRGNIALGKTTTMVPWVNDRL